MPSNRPDPSSPTRRARALLVAVGLAAVAVLAVPSVAGAQSDGDQPGSDQPATTVAEVGPVSDCSPGHIVRRPDCGIPPESATDPGGWIQVSLFYLLCGAVVLIVAGVWWRSRQLRAERSAAGLDPLTLAQASGQGVRRSTRSEPVAETSSN
jgi:hypothetical protein